MTKNQIKKKISNFAKKHPAYAPAADKMSTVLASGTWPTCMEVPGGPDHGGIYGDLYDVWADIHDFFLVPDPNGRNLFYPYG